MTGNTTMNIAKPAAPTLSPELIAKFRSIVGEKYAMTDAANIAPYLTEERDLYHGRSPLVLRPGSTAEVSAICRLASEHRNKFNPPETCSIRFPNALGLEQEGATEYWFGELRIWRAIDLFL